MACYSACGAGLSPSLALAVATSVLAPRMARHLGGCGGYITRRGRGPHATLTHQRHFCVRSSARKEGEDNHLLAQDFQIKKAVLLKKVTRYEFEKVTNPDLNEAALKEYLISKGSDYASLLQRHDDFQRQLEVIQELLTKHGVEFHTVHKLGYVAGEVDWADAIFTAGGDGTFLMAANKVKGHGKPVIGINTDPERSEGYLCLPKAYSTQGKLDAALAMMLSGRMAWHWRQRIRLTMSGTRGKNEPVDLYRQQLEFPEHRFWEHVRENELLSRVAERPEGQQPAPLKILPILALNEVFIGESLAARVSFYEMSTDGSDLRKQKSSGMTACTGTGSTSWYFNTNHLSDQSVRDILHIARSKAGASAPTLSDEAITEITDQFNSSLRFDPSESKLAYTVRDAVAGGIYQVKQPRGFCRRMKIRSRMWDGWVVVDGGMSFRFNDGAVMELEVREEDALRCVRLLDSPQ